ncbi:MAG: beta-xylosidase [Chthoniobacterales bacterium]|nr:beta-xylosidase [Chthoniobacterales bacterium]
MNKANFTCDCTGSEKAFPHYWEHTVGSGHATLALRADWQEQLRRCRKELGFRHVRFHGILDDDMGTFLIENDQPLYSFFNTDQIFDFLLSIDMKPLVELSFMPSGLSSGSKTAFHYNANVTPPRDYDAWATLIGKLAQHWVERYGLKEVSQWFFEVWNEPNLKAFGTGKKSDYFKLYQYTSHALKSVDVSLRVGGPVTAKNAWIPDFLDFCGKQKLPIDFVSTHHYPTDAFGSPGDDTETQLAESKRSILREEAAKAKKQAKGKPLFYTEWNSSSNPRDKMHDEPYAAAFIVKTIMEAQGLVECYSYWTFSDIFEENYFPSEPFQGGFGLITINGIAKPAYRAYELLHDLGDEALTVRGHHDTVDVSVVRNKKAVTILITNFALPRHPIKMEDVHITLENLTKAPARARLRRIDHDHANARRRWEEIGSPEYLSTDALGALKKASKMITEKLEFDYQVHRLELNVAVPPLGIAAIKLKD